MDQVEEIGRHERTRRPDPRRLRTTGLPPAFRRVLPLDRLPPRERQIAHIIYARGEASAAEVCDALGSGVSNAAVRSMLRRLEAKGVIQRRKQGRKFIYAPSRPAAETGLQALHALIDRHFNRSPMEAALMLLGMSSARDAAQHHAIARLSALLKQVELD